MLMYKVVNLDNGDELGRYWLSAQPVNSDMRFDPQLPIAGIAVHLDELQGDSLKWVEQVGGIHKDIREAGVSAYSEVWKRAEAQFPGNVYVVRV